MLTQADIDAIVNQKNLVLRNLQITLGYHWIALGLRRLISPVDVNWFAFGAYASKTAGRAIRHEALPQRVKSAMIRLAGFDDTLLFLGNVLGDEDNAQLTEEDNLWAEALKRVSLLVSEGNLKIFNEVAYPFTALADRFYREYDYDPDAFDAFLAELDLRPGPVEAGGQDLMIESLRTFYEARFAPDHKRQGELMFRANILVGLHEQSRLQPQIEQAIAVPFDMFFGEKPPSRAGRPGMRTVFQNQAVRVSREWVMQVFTQMLMTYALPTRDMKLGDTIVRPTGAESFPTELVRLDDPRLRELVGQFSAGSASDTGTDLLRQSAAANWGRLHDRMTYLVTLFRSYQHYDQLFDPPFSRDQMLDIAAGRVPEGPL